MTIVKFEEKLARFREEQKKGTRMKQHRTKLIKQLEEQMESTTDPQLKLDLAKQITKLMPRPRQRKAKAKEAAPARNGTSALVAKWADRISHVQPEGKRIETTLICEVEQRLKSRGIQAYPPTTESRALLVKVIKEVSDEFSAEERALLPQAA